MKRKFYICSTGNPSEGYNRENLENCKKHKAYIIHKDAAHKGVFDEIKPDAIILLKHNDLLIAYSEVSGSEKLKDEEESLDGWTWRQYVKEWVFYDRNNSAKGVSNYGVSERVVSGDQMAAVKEVDYDYGLQKMREIDADSELYRTVSGGKIMKKYIDLLETNKNLILTGAPGTGKTHLARDIAKELVGKAAQDAQIGFVQFHPSYDYTDFVEGLRPVKREGNQEIGFELKNGIFKEFCKNALNAFKDDKDKPVEQKRKFVFIIDEINRGEISKIFGELFFSVDPGYRGKEGKVQTQYANMQSVDTDFDSELGKGWFYVPENVYLIGTMNDIDRSVESFDFAMRRRFVWKEVTAEESAETMPLSDNSKERMRRLNNAIFPGQDRATKGVDGLNASYHIGGAYFLNLDKERKVIVDNKGIPANPDFDALWDNRLEPLLKEYVRGMQGAEEKLEQLKTAYDEI